MSDRWLKRLWLVNGIVLLPLLITAGVAMVLAAGSGLWGREDGVTAEGPAEAGGAPVEARAVRPDHPQRIAGSTTRLIAIRHGQGSYPSEGFGLGTSSYSFSGDRYSEGPVVNVLFLGRDGVSDLLFDRPAVITSLDYPRPDAEDEGQEWLAFHAVLEDTNENGRLDRQDRRDLYLSDLNGAGLRRALTDSVSIRSHTRLRDPERLLVYALDMSSNLAEEDRPVRAFLVDPATGAAEPHGEMNALIERAGRIVGK